MTTTTKFAMGSTTVDLAKINDNTLLDNLPAGVYTLRWHKLRGFYLDIGKKNLEVPSKIYGRASKRVDKVMRTYQERETSTGILLTGDKGTGKSLLMACIANAAIDSLSMPVIIIKEGFAGTEFTNFIEAIGECCIIFDEFGKMYKSMDTLRKDEEERTSQSKLLSMLDGVDKTKRLLLFTENREIDINTYLLNRPSRIYYHFKYAKLEEDAIVDYCKDFSVKQEVVDEILHLVRRSRLFSFDMLQTIVEEHLRFGEDVKTLLEELNVHDAPKSEQKATVISLIDRETGKQEKIARRVVTLTSDDDEEFHVVYERENEEAAEWQARVDAGEFDSAQKSLVERQGYLTPSKELHAHFGQWHLQFEKGSKRLYDNGTHIVEVEMMPEEAPLWGSAVTH